MSGRVSLSALADAGVRLRPPTAAGIVSEFCRQIISGQLRGVPCRHVIRITEDGDIVAEGPIGADRATVIRAATLLDDLLPSDDAGTEDRPPGGLRLLVARALGTIDLPPYAGLDEFRRGLERFATADLQEALREAYAACAEVRLKPDATQNVAGPAVPARTGTVLPAAIRRFQTTISDIRRARRATGLSLRELSQRSRVPAALLRELEWGYLRNWPAGHYGRAQLVRYARAAGLDERLVIGAAWPLLEDAVAARSGEDITPQPAEQSIDELMPVNAVDAAPVIETVPLRALPFPQAAAPSGRRRYTAALAIAATLLLALVPMLYQRTHESGVHQTIAARAHPSSPPAPRVTTGAGRTEPIPQPRHTQHLSDRVVPGATPVRAVRDAAAYSPSFSNVGTATFFHEEETGHSSLVRADTDARGTVLKITRIVDDNARNYHARPSPDGSQIAFDSDREGTRAVYVADASGQHVRRISGDGFAAVPSWSPDGRQVALAKAEPDTPTVWNLWTVDLASGQLHRLTSYRFGQPWGGSWFPDGRRIAYSHEDQLVILDIPTGRRTVFRTPLKGHLVRTPAVSPDGRRVIFQVHHDGAWLLDVRSGAMRRVLDDASAAEYTWSPDGHRVAFHSDRSGGWGVWVMGQP